MKIRYFINPAKSPGRAVLLIRPFYWPITPFNQNVTESISILILKHIVSKDEVPTSKGLS